MCKKMDKIWFVKIYTKLKKILDDNLRNIIIGKNNKDIADSNRVWYDVECDDGDRGEDGCEDAGSDDGGWDGGAYCCVSGCDDDDADDEVGGEDCCGGADGGDDEDDDVTDE